MKVDRVFTQEFAVQYLGSTANVFGRSWRIFTYHNIVYISDLIETPENTIRNTAVDYVRDQTIELVINFRHHCIRAVISAMINRLRGRLADVAV